MTKADDTSPPPRGPRRFTGGDKTEAQLAAAEILAALELIESEKLLKPKPNPDYNAPRVPKLWDLSEEADCLLLGTHRQGVKTPYIDGLSVAELGSVEKIIEAR